MKFTFDHNNNAPDLHKRLGFYKKAFNEKRGRSFISDPYGYWTKIIPAGKNDE